MDFHQHWRWSKLVASHLRFPFVDSERIIANYSQAWQDIFVLSVLDGMKNGTYLEIGAQKADAYSNSYLLHKGFNWNGISIEIDPMYMGQWRALRPDSVLVVTDALKIDYSVALPLWFGEHARIDYLQLDIDPSYNTLLALKRLPLDTFRFSVITMETDAYLGDLRAQHESRKILSHFGYELVASDVVVPFPVPVPFEDWWVDPQAVDAKKIKNLRSLSKSPCWAQDLLFKLPNNKV